MTRDQAQKAAGRRLSRLVYRMDSAWVDRRLYRQKKQRAELPSLSQLQEYEPPEVGGVIDSPYFLMGHNPCLGYSGCNCWECGCDCGRCFKCDPRSRFPMSAEQTLLTHWRACVETRDPVCLRAFADHLMEQWATAEMEDGEFTRSTGVAQWVIRLEHNGLQLKVDHAAPRFDSDGNITNTGNVDVAMIPRGVVRSFTDSRVVMNRPSPTAWDYGMASEFASLIAEFLSSNAPNTLQERSSTNTGG